MISSNKPHDNQLVSSSFNSTHFSIHFTLFKIINFLFVVVVDVYFIVA